jgi:metal-responsive CopG/Arc/MetJ family transcriptional regulator
MKVAVSIPDSIFQAADRLAQERNMPRSQLFAEALASYLEVHGSKAITAALNEIYADEKSGLDQEWQHAQSGVLENETW